MIVSNGITRLRNRSSIAYKGEGIEQPYDYWGNPTSPSKRTVAAYDSKWMTDSTHGPRPRGKTAGLIDWGGDMQSTSTTWTDLGRNVDITIPPYGFVGKNTYKGYWWPMSPWTISPLVVPSTSYLNAMGAKGIAQASPTAPQAGMTQFLSELKDIPKAPILGLYQAIARGGRKKDFIKRAGNGIGHEYLNFEFGWRPLVKDMQDFHKSIANASKTIDQYLKDSGRVVRRRRELLSETSTTPITGSVQPNVGSGPGGVFLSAVENTTGTRTEINKIWFEGSFTYYVSPGGTYISEAKRNEQILNKLLGTRFGIDTLWELTPWSWALDWVGNIGDVATNLAAFSNDGLIMRYGYVMYHQKVTESRSLTARFKSDNTFQSTTATLVREYKMRQAATPYGFGLTWSGFNNRQLAIAAAIGLTRR